MARSADHAGKPQTAHSGQPTVASLLQLRTSACRRRRVRSCSPQQGSGG
jgi:hypothetical protein